jgi:para-nitrobenzyl esterase
MFRTPSRRRLRKALNTWALTLALALPAASVGAAEPRVQLPQGAVVGQARDGVAVFRGIPFAAPPVGPLRWRPPQPARPWPHELKADAFGPGCPQPRRPGGVAPGGVERFAPPPTDEDCLTLNVWSRGKPGERLPVMVWIHGGAFRVGGSSLPYFDGEAFARQGVVVVTFNYRLGRLGFFAHPLIVKEAAGEPIGNYGLMDQIAALRWVKANIAQFGGDPGNVTAFGESAGGSSLLFLLTSPAAKGLFQKAIVESGGGWQPAAPLAEKERSDEAAVAASGKAAANTADLRAMSVADILAMPMGGIGQFGPFADGAIVRESPRAALTAGRAMDVPLIIGTNSDEATPLMRAFGADPQAVLRQLGPRGAEIYRGDGASPQVTAHHAYTDAAFPAPARWVAARTAGGAPTWLYQFSYVPERKREPDVGASHGAEIPFVFASWDDIPGANAFLTAKDRAMEGLMNRCWASFAKTGTPQCGATAWPRYDAASDALMAFGDESKVLHGFRKPMLDWQERRALTSQRGRALGQGER